MNSDWYIISCNSLEEVFACIDEFEYKRGNKDDLKDSLEKSCVSELKHSSVGVRIRSGAFDGWADMDFYKSDDEFCNGDYEFINACDLFQYCAIDMNSDCDLSVLF